MKNTYIILLSVILFWGCQSTSSKVERTSDFNFDWQFALLDINQKESSLDDVTKDEWKNVRLPHDWVIGNDYDSANAEFAPATGYIYGGGIGWYKKTFNLDITKNQKAFILFDGVYNQSTVYLNGQELGFHPYGYSPFYYDLTPYLKNGKENTLAVKVDHSNFADSRWYTGAGIYRNVELVVTDKLHIPVWGSFITTPEVSEEKAVVSIITDINNSYTINKKAIIKTELYTQSGKLVAEVSEEKLIKAGESITVAQEATIEKPELWGVDNPNLYLAKTKILVDNGQIDELTNNFGVRSIKFDADSGFFLNGQNMKIKGVCLHHDGGLVGTAVPKDVWRRRLQVLKDGGCNAIRIAHNPGSDEFLDLCDEMGFLVQDEFFDEWDNPKDKRWNQNEQSKNVETEGYASKYFLDYAESDLKAVMLAHRNHPSIFQWSIGNEIEWTYPRISQATGFFNNMNWNGNYFWSKSPYSIEKIRSELKRLPKRKNDIGSTASKLAKWTKELDTTRPVTANCILPSASHETDYGKSLDIVGYSYRRVLYDYGHKNYPDKVIMGTENLAQYHEWKAIMDRPFIAGTFFWTGINYLGEIRAPWPNKGNDAGMIDFAGFPKPSYQMMKTLWTDKPHTFIATQTLSKSINKIDKKSGKMVAKNPKAWETALWEWHDVNNHWNYNEGEVVSVELYSNCDEIELFLNEKSLGKRTLAEFDDHIYKWAVPFEKGVLSAIGKKDGKTTETKLITAGKPVAVKLEIDRKVLSNNQYDVAHVVAQLVDAQGNPVTNVERVINFEIPEYLRDLGVDNGANTNIQNHTLRKIETDNGRALLVLQSTQQAGEVEVKATVDGLSSDRILLSIGEDNDKKDDIVAELN